MRKTKTQSDEVVKFEVEATGKGKIKSLVILNQDFVLMTFDKDGSYYSILKLTKGVYKEFHQIQLPEGSSTQHCFPFVITLLDKPFLNYHILHLSNQKEYLIKEPDVGAPLIFLCGHSSVVFFTKTHLFALPYDQLDPNDPHAPPLIQLELGAPIEMIPSPKNSSIHDDCALVMSQIDILLFDITTGNCLFKKDTPPGIISLLYYKTSNGTPKIAGFNDNTIYIWDVTERTEITVTLSTSLFCMCLMSSHNLLVGDVSGVASILNGETAQKIVVLNKPTENTKNKKEENGAHDDQHALTRHLKHRIRAVLSSPDLPAVIVEKNTISIFNPKALEGGPVNVRKFDTDLKVFVEGEMVDFDGLVSNCVYLFNGSLYIIKECHKIVCWNPEVKRSAFRKGTANSNFSLELIKQKLNFNSDDRSYINESSVLIRTRKKKKSAYIYLFNDTLLLAWGNSNKETQAREIPLSNAFVIESEHESDAFLLLELEEQTAYYIYTRSEEDRNDWIDRIEVLTAELKHTAEYKKYTDIRLARISYHFNTYLRSSRIFGIPIECFVKRELCNGRISTNVPLFLNSIIDHLENCGFDTIGLFQTAILEGDVTNIKKRINSGEPFELSVKHDIHLITQLLVVFLKQLPTPIIPFSILSRFPINLNNNKKLISILLFSLPPANLETLKKVLTYLGRFYTKHDLKDRPEVLQLFAQLIFWEKGESSVSLLRYLILYHSVLWSDRQRVLEKDQGVILAEVNEAVVIRKVSSALSVVKKICATFTLESQFADYEEGFKRLFGSLYSISMFSASELKMFIDTSLLDDFLLVSLSLCLLLDTRKKRKKNFKEEMNYLFLQMDKYLEYFIVYLSRLHNDYSNNAISDEIASEKLDEFWMLNFGNTYLVEMDKFLEKVEIHPSEIPMLRYLLFEHSCLGYVDYFKYKSFVIAFGGNPLHSFANFHNLVSSDWFYGFVTHQHVEKLLTYEEVGTYLVRLCRSVPGNFVIEYKSKKASVPLALKVYAAEEGFCVKSKKGKESYKTIQDILTKYSDNFTLPYKTDLFESSCYHGVVTLEEAEEQLLEAVFPTGSYMFHLVENSLICSYKTDKVTIAHTRITINLDPKFHLLVGTTKYSSLRSLIEANVHTLLFPYLTEGKRGHPRIFIKKKSIPSQEKDISNAFPTSPLSPTPKIRSSVDHSSSGFKLFRKEKGSSEQKSQESSTRRSSYPLRGLSGEHVKKIEEAFPSPKRSFITDSHSDSHKSSPYKPSKSKRLSLRKDSLKSLNISRPGSPMMISDEIPIKKIDDMESLNLDLDQALELKKVSSESHKKLLNSRSSKKKLMRSDDISGEKLKSSPSSENHSIRTLNEHSNKASAEHSIKPSSDQTNSDSQHAKQATRSSKHHSPRRKEKSLYKHNQHKITSYDELATLNEAEKKQQRSSNSVPTKKRRHTHSKSPRTSERHHLKSVKSKDALPVLTTDWDLIYYIETTDL